MDTTDIVVSRLSSAVALLSEAKSAQDAKKVADLARAAEVYARRQKLGDEAEAWARTIKLQAERLLGEFLAAAPKAKATDGERDARGRIPIGSKRGPMAPPTLSSLGITKNESARAQRLAAMPEEEFEKLKKPTKSGRRPKKNPTEVLVNYWGTQLEIMKDSVDDALSLPPETKAMLWDQFAVPIIRNLRKLEPKGR